MLESPRCGIQSGRIIGAPDRGDNRKTPDFGLPKAFLR